MLVKVHLAGPLNYENRDSLTCHPQQPSIQDLLGCGTWRSREQSLGHRHKCESASALENLLAVRVLSLGLRSLGLCPPIPYVIWQIRYEAQDWNLAFSIESEVYFKWAGKSRWWGRWVRLKLRFVKSTEEQAVTCRRFQVKRCSEQEAHSLIPTKSWQSALLMR